MVYLFLVTWKIIYTSDLNKTTFNGTMQSTNNKGDRESAWKIPRFISTPPKDWLLHIESILYGFILWDKKCLICPLTPTTAWKVSKYGVFYGPFFPVFGLNAGKYGPEKTPYLYTFHAVNHTKNVVTYHVLSYNKSMRLQAFSFSFTPLKVSFCP